MTRKTSPACSGAELGGMRCGASYRRSGKRCCGPRLRRLSISVTSRSVPTRSRSASSAACAASASSLLRTSSSRRRVWPRSRRVGELGRREGANSSNGRRPVSRCSRESARVHWVTASPMRSSRARRSPSRASRSGSSWPAFHNIRPLDLQRAVKSAVLVQNVGGGRAVETRLVDAELNRPGCRTQRPAPGDPRCSFAPASTLPVPQLGSHQRGKHRASVNRV